MQKWIAVNVSILLCALCWLMAVRKLAVAALNTVRPIRWLVAASKILLLRTSPSEPMVSLILLSARILYVARRIARTGNRVISADLRYAETSDRQRQPYDVALSQLDWSLRWCRQQGSNPRPPDYKSGALPTELYRPDALSTHAPGVLQPLMAKSPEMVLAVACRRD